ncbi:hypothetical protein [Mycolicibacterium tokaiense]|uniref:hypothetical protein n=1 Tax=Mycolicibacterium tokaiense TaxID=39695 RepID=UPI001E5B3F48|nr:hypothetical protein [Mycolicibacterium tokaiense]
MGLASICARTSSQLAANPGCSGRSATSSMRTQRNLPSPFDVALIGYGTSATTVE